MNFRILICLIPVLVAIGATHFYSAPFSSQDLGYIEKRLEKAWNISLVQRIVTGIDGEVYKGRQGIDYLAVQLSSSKHYHDQESWFNQGASEWECLKLTDHPNLPMVFDRATYSLGQTDAVRVILSELLGPNLRQIEKLYETTSTSANSGLPLFVVVRIAQDVSSALVHLHSLFVAHHNVKLENIAMTDSPQTDGTSLTRQLAQAQYKLIGLGLCQDYANRTAMETVYRAGDHLYASPEKLNSSQPYNAFLADAYALGATLARALMGEHTRLAILERIHRRPHLQLVRNPMDTVFRLYREHWLSDRLEDQENTFFHLIGQLLEPVASKRMSVDKFLSHL